MSEVVEELRPLHLHTLESLIGDLVSGRAASVGPDCTPWRLVSDDCRAVLAWYGARREVWAKNVTDVQTEEIVDAACGPPPPAAAHASPSAAAREPPRRLRLKTIRAHRFAGVHSHGTAERQPVVYSLEPDTPVTLLEGPNGSGKTSLLNAVAWCLTGRVLRAQRPPE